MYALVQLLFCQTCSIPFKESILKQGVGTGLADPVAARPKFPIHYKDPQLKILCCCL